MKNPLKNTEPLTSWKKGLGEGEYYKTNDKYSYTRVWKIGLSSKERKRRGIGTYGFSGRIGRMGQTTKRYFKTKSQALYFAKSYRGTH